MHPTTAAILSAPLPYDAHMLPLDLADLLAVKANSAAKDREGMDVHLYRYQHLGTPLHVMWVPAARRAGICHNATTQWTDAVSVEDALDRWASDTSKCYGRVTPEGGWSNCVCSYCANQIWT